MFSPFWFFGLDVFHIVYIYNIVILKKMSRHFFQKTKKIFQIAKTVRLSPFKNANKKPDTNDCIGFHSLFVRQACKLLKLNA